MQLKKDLLRGRLITNADRKKIKVKSEIHISLCGNSKQMHCSQINTTSMCQIHTFYSSLMFGFDSELKAKTALVRCCSQVDIKERKLQRISAMDERFSLSLSHKTN